MGYFRTHHTELLRFGKIKGAFLEVSPRISLNRHSVPDGLTAIRSP